MITVLIVSDIRLYREGLADVVAQHAGFQLAGTAADGDTALAAVRSRSPDMVLVDMAMAGSPGVIRAIRELTPDMNVVALSVADTEGDVCACAEAGVTGYVARDATLSDLMATLESAVRGEALCSPRMAGSLLRRLAELAKAQPVGASSTHLTPRELEIVRLLDDGLANKDIARRLGIEVATVKNHVHNILEKLQVHRRGEAAAWGRQLQTRHALGSMR